MRAAESSYAGYPDSVPELMERAGGATALWAMHLVPNAQSWTVVCGGGSNGGDGRVAARHLEEAGRRVRVVDAKAGDTDLGEPDAIVDALFGTGFSGAPRPEAAALIERINAAGKPVLSVDLPSGVDMLAFGVAGDLLRALPDEQRPTAHELLPALVRKAELSGGPVVLHPLHGSSARSGGASLVTYSKTEVQ